MDENKDAQPVDAARDTARDAHPSQVRPNEPDLFDDDLNPDVEEDRADYDVEETNRKEDTA
jgi:hypothetical protein